MTRLIIFLSVLAGFVIALVMFSYKSLPVTNDKFDIKTVEAKFQADQTLVQELTTPKEVVVVEEVQVKEYAPVVELSTPELVKGNKLYGQCISCHGKGGEGRASQKAPFIGGQYDWYLEKQLTDMKNGVRVNAAMAVIVKGLSPQDMKDLSAYVSRLPWKKEVAAAPEAEAAPAQ